MVKEGAVSLDTNDTFPEMDLKLVSGQTLRLPEGTGEGYGIILFYSGSWWPFCIQQLAEFQKWATKFESEQVSIIAGSVDPIEKAEEAIEKSGVTYPVAYGLTAEEISRVTGAYYDRDKKFLHATGFLLRPDNTIEVACYSTGPIGRFGPKDALRLVKFYKGKK